MTHKKGLIQLSNELTYHRYMISHKQAEGLFKCLTVPEYIVLQHISHSIIGKNNDENRVYLKDIAEELGMAIPKASKMVRKLNDKGLVTWEHDGNGSDGTYVIITQSGMTLMNEQQNILKNYYSRVINDFGEEKLVTLLQMMKDLEIAMDLELNVGDDENGE